MGTPAHARERARTRSVRRQRMTCVRRHPRACAHMWHARHVRAARWVRTHLGVVRQQRGGDNVRVGGRVAGIIRGGGVHQRSGSQQSRDTCSQGSVHPPTHTSVRAWVRTRSVGAQTGRAGCQGGAKPIPATCIRTALAWPRGRSLVHGREKEYPQPLSHGAHHCLRARVQKKTSAHPSTAAGCALPRAYVHHNACGRTTMPCARSACNLDASFIPLAPSARVRAACASSETQGQGWCTPLCPGVGRIHSIRQPLPASPRCGTRSTHQTPYDDPCLRLH